MARQPLKWSERSESSRKRILSWGRKNGLTDRQIREGTNRGSLRPYARNPVNRASPRMRKAHPELTAKLTGQRDRETLFRSARAHWEDALSVEVSGVHINPDALDRSVQWMFDNKLDSLASAMLRMDGDQLLSLARAQSKKELQKKLANQLTPAELSKLGWASRSHKGKTYWHNPFFYH